MSGEEKIGEGEGDEEEKGMEEDEDMRGRLPEPATAIFDHSLPLWVNISRAPIANLQTEYMCCSQALSFFMPRITHSLFTQPLFVHSQFDTLLHSMCATSSLPLQGVTTKLYKLQAYV